MKPSGERKNYYDMCNRLIRSEYSDGYEIQYEYDDIHNILHIADSNELECWFTYEDTDDGISIKKLIRKKNRRSLLNRLMKAITNFFNNIKRVN